MQYNNRVEKTSDTSTTPPAPVRAARTRRAGRGSGNPAGRPSGDAAERTSSPAGDRPSGRAGGRPRGRREIAKAEKRARILAAARGLIGEKGYAHMSMSEVAERADVAAGTVFQYATSKAELLMMVTESIWADHVRGALRATPETTPASPTAVVDAIMDSLAPIFDMAVHWPETTVWIAREILFGDELPHRLAVLGLVEVLEDHIAGILGGGRGAPSDAETTRLDVGARMIMTTGLAELNRARQGRADMAGVLGRMREVVTLVAAGATARA